MFKATELYDLTLLRDGEHGTVRVLAERYGQVLVARSGNTYALLHAASERPSGRCTRQECARKLAKRLAEYDLDGIEQRRIDGALMEEDAASLAQIRGLREHPSRLADLEHREPFSLL